MQWFSKVQTTVETSVFGDKFVTMKQSIDTLKGIKNKLRMMRTPMSGPSNIHGDNISVVYITFRPESVFRKESN